MADAMESITKRTAPTLIPFVWARNIETEHRLALVHVGIGIAGVVVSLVPSYFRLLPVIMPGSVYLGILISFLVYSVIYVLWSPYRRYSLRRSAAAITILDIIVATFIILNTGGIASTFWGLWAAVVLTYTIRFPVRWWHWPALAVVFGGIVTAAFLVVPIVPVNRIVLVMGVTFSMAAVLASGLVLVAAERRAVRDGMSTEHKMIHRIINTVQHEINNPLTIAGGNLNRIQHQPTSGELRNWLRNIEESLQRISTAVERLKDLEEDRIVETVGSVEWFSSGKQVASPSSSM
jgi:signal transduction histidine kinase